MDLRPLRLLMELSRLGFMRAVADHLGYTTSTVSQQLALLAREAGAMLLEPEGRRVRLTPAERRLAEHAATILATVEAARADLPDAEPARVVRVAGFATGIRRSLVPVLARLSAGHPAVTVRIREHEPGLRPARRGRNRPRARSRLQPRAGRLPAGAQAGPPVGDGVGPRRAAGGDDARGRRALGVRPPPDAGWIVNLRHTADETVVRTIASMAGFEPRIAHGADSLELVRDLIVAGEGVGLLPSAPPVPGVRLLPLRGPT